MNTILLMATVWDCMGFGLIRLQTSGKVMWVYFYSLAHSTSLLCDHAGTEVLSVVNVYVHCSEVSAIYTVNAVGQLVCTCSSYLFMFLKSVAVSGHPLQSSQAYHDHICPSSKSISALVGVVKELTPLLSVHHSIILGIITSLIRLLLTYVRPPDYSIS